MHDHVTYFDDTHLVIAMITTSDLRGYRTGITAWLSQFDNQLVEPIWPFPQVNRPHGTCKRFHTINKCLCYSYVDSFDDSERSRPGNTACLTCANTTGQTMLMIQTPIHKGISASLRAVHSPISIVTCSTDDVAQSNLK